MWSFSLFPCNLFVFNILPDFLYLFHIVNANNVQRCNRAFAHFPFLISDVCDVKTTSKGMFSYLLFYTELALEVDCAMLFNVVIAVISTYGPHLHTPEK